ncbi:unnamed protein product [Mytilus coruscus]|uniref:Endonuclease/exonuclease/phosphatase domain-containing protein n=1 Tax=Mytilus coruscus TaxID=42192 RepID=A0A6J8ANT4_MYTCO|nr:unnamed protein product [Mytilus coruscus]
MSNSKLVKFLNNTKEQLNTQKKYIPVVFSDSKGNWLKNHVNRSHSVEKEIIWWCKSGAKIVDRLQWLQTTLNIKTKELGAIWIYVWLGTCDLTSYNKKYISINTYTDETINHLIEYYNKIIELVQQYDNCKVTILETPVYSIYRWNCHRKHKMPEEFKEQDNILADQVIRLNFKIKELNTSINSHSPKFSNDLQTKSKYKKGDHRTATTRTSYNYNLYTDGIHPDNLLAKTWLKKIAEQAQLNWDIEQNPGPRTKQPSIYPCGLCEHPVTWNCEGVCCDDYYDLLQRSNVQWLCCKCESINVSTCTFHSYELNTSNYYDPLTHNSTFESITLNAFSPLKASSPKGINSMNNNTSKSNKSKNRTNSSNVFNIPKKQNLRILTLNCRSIKDKTSEFSAAVNYIKPDIICGTQSWLKGEHPGKKPTKDAIKSNEVFPENYTAYSNDLGTLGGGVFILEQNDIIAIEKPEFVTKCEIEWVKIQLKDKKDLTIGSFYMPHRNMEDIKELDKSLDHISNKNQTIILTGDFNCPDLKWNTMTVHQNAQYKEIQRALMEVIISHSLTQIHETPTRGNNLLDIVVTSNPSLIKTSSNAPGISDHDMIVTDCDTKPHYQSKKPRKYYIYSKAKWEDLHKDLTILSTNITEMYHTGATVQELWDKFKTDLYSNLDNHIPSKLIRSKTSLPWINHKIRKMFKKKTRLYQQAKKTNNWTNYRHFQKECKRQIRKAEWNYINTTILEVDIGRCGVSANETTLHPNNNL